MCQLQTAALKTKPPHLPSTLPLLSTPSPVLLLLLIAITIAAMPVPVHLVVIQHGLWGSSENLSYLTTTLAKYHGGLVTSSSKLTPPESASTISVHAESHPNAKRDDIRMAVLNSEVNGGDRTYDGVDWCGERLVKEVYREIEELEKEEQGVVVERLSLIGYSLGGLVIRYAAGLMYADGFFKGSKEGNKLPFKSRPTPTSLSTIATPHLGVTVTRSTFSKVSAHFGATILGRTGKQLYLADRGWIPPSSITGAEEEAGEGLCLLEALVDPRFSFLPALKAFSRIDIYANAVADLTVSYRTAAFEEHDPFLHPPSLISLERDSDHPPLLVSFSLNDISPPPKSVWKKVTSALSPKNLPWILNPQRFPFKFPLNYVAWVCLPVLLPVMIGLVLHKLKSDSKGSNKRVAEFERLWGVENGHIPDDPPAAVTNGKAKTPKVKALDRETLDGLERQRKSKLLAQVEAEVEETFREVGEDHVESTPHDNAASTTPLQEGEEDQRYTIKSNTPTAFPTGFSTWPIAKDEVPLTDTQLRIATKLNDKAVLPQVKKHLAHFDDVLNAHAVIIVRTVGMEVHRKGVPLIKAFVQRFGL